jgi:hypothetical protein
MKIKLKRIITSREALYWTICIWVCIFFVAGALWYRSSLVPYKINTLSVKKPKAKPISAFQKEFGADTAMLISLHDTLMKREGYSATIYNDKKGFHYIGAGHQLLKCDTFTRLTLHQSDSLLWVDLKSRYYIVQQQRKQRIFKLFISGK